MSKIANVILRPKPVAFFININDTYISVIAKKTNITYSHSCKMVKEFDDALLIKTCEHGRVTIVNLTRKGNAIKELLENILRVLEKC